jgi:TRAP transporter TAXI family solute receptor
MLKSDLEETGGEPFRRRKTRNSWVLIIAASILLFAAAAGTSYLALRPVTLRIAVGPPGGDDHKLIQAVAQAFAGEGSKVRLSLITTDGTIESIALLAATKTDLAVARGDLEMPSNAGSVAILRKNVVVLWSPSGPKGSRKAPTPKIRGIDGLAGHRVGVIGRTKENVTLLRSILTESGVNPEKVAITQFGTNQIAEMARDPAIDAIMTVGPLDSKVTSDAIAASASARGEPIFLPIGISQTIAERHPLYKSDEIPRSSFSSLPARPDDTVETVSVNHLIIAPRSLSEATVAAFVRQLFAVRQSLAKESPGAAKIEVPSTNKDAALPAHQGAAAYIDGTETTFLERYSDYMWAAILLLSVLGSCGTLLRQYLKRGEREENTLHRGRLLDTIARVRQAQTSEELDAMESEADRILRETLECYDDGAIEEGALSALRLVMEQFDEAVVERRAAIGANAPDPPRMRAR